MSNDTSSGFDGEGFDFSSSGSSDSEFFLDEDVQTDGNINKEWEAIERTLYQEPGQHVTDPELLRECKMWRETFPHFRVKGTKIQAKPDEGDAEKSIQTVGSHFDMKKVKEKRESIKNKIVEELVERLIAKFNLNKGSCDENGKKESETKALVKSIGSVNTSTEKESYFERGKVETEDPGVSKREMQTKLIQMLDSWEKEDKKPGSTSPGVVGPQNNFDPLRKASSPNSILKSIERQRFKPEKPIYTTNFAPKPFEMTKKIDKKYEALLDRIIERQGGELEPARLCRTTSSEAEAKAQPRSLEKMRLGSGFDDYPRRHKSIPRINNFNNNWLDRGEAYYRGVDQVPERFSEYKPQESDEKFVKAYYRGVDQVPERFSEYKPQESDEKFIKQLKKEVLVYKRPARNMGVTEDISLRRPKPFRIDESTHKSSSCGSLVKNKKNPRSTHTKVGGKVGSSKSSAKLSSGKGSQGGLLPPIESGIICTELTGRPKVGPRKPSKRY